MITGSSSGIGLAASEAFAEHGWTVCGVDKKFSQKGRQAIQDSKGLSFEASVNSFADAHKFVDSIQSKLERVDALVTCAGNHDDGTLPDISEEQWDETVMTNLKGTFNYIHAVAKLYREQKSGKIVTVASTAALRARSGLPAHIASKSAIIGLTRACARDLGKFNVNVNCVCPGIVNTPLSKTIPENILEKLREETCLKRNGEPVDIARVIYFLCTDDARHVTGEVIRVDGGQLS